MVEVVVTAIGSPSPAARLQGPHGLRAVLLTDRCVSGIRVNRFELFSPLQMRLVASYVTQGRQRRSAESTRTMPFRGGIRMKCNRETVGRPPLDPPVPERSGPDFKQEENKLDA